MARSAWRRSRSPAASAWKPATRIFTGGRSTRSCATGSRGSPRARRSPRPRRHDLRGRPEMVFMVIEHFRPGRAPEIYRRFRERGRMAPAGLRYVASWVDMDFKRCYQVMETEDAALFRQWTANWDDLGQFDIVPVRTPAEAAAPIEG